MFVGRSGNFHTFFDSFVTNFQILSVRRSAMSSTIMMTIIATALSFSLYSHSLHSNDDHYRHCPFFLPVLPLTPLTTIATALSFSLHSHSLHSTHSTPAGIP